MQAATLSSKAWAAWPAPSRNSNTWFCIYSLRFSSGYSLHGAGHAAHALLNSVGRLHPAELRLQRVLPRGHLCVGSAASALSASCPKALTVPRPVRRFWRMASVAAFSACWACTTMLGWPCSSPMTTPLAWVSPMVRPAASNERQDHLGLPWLPSPSAKFLGGTLHLGHALGDPLGNAAHEPAADPRRWPTSWAVLPHEQRRWPSPGPRAHGPALWPPRPCC